MNIQTTIGSVVLLFFVSNVSALDWEFVSLTPNCRAGFFCEKDEVISSVEQSGLSKRLLAMAERARIENGQVYMAFMSFSETSLFEGLCDLGRNGLKLEGFFDSKAGPPSGLGHRLETECQSPGKINITINYMGMPASGRSGWRLHHNKYFIAQYDSNLAEMAFGSANVSFNGVSVNFENWNFVTGNVQDEFISDHLCNARAMHEARRAGADEDDPKVFREVLESCLSYSDLSPGVAEGLLVREGGIAMFSPDPLNRTFKLLEDQIDRVPKGSRIQLAVYFFMHKELIEALRRASSRGVSVEILIDDDLSTGQISMPTQKRYWRELIRPEVSGFKIREFDTNENIFQLQHNKYVILYDVDGKQPPRVFGGAGQFTRSAFETNYENFFLVQDSNTVEAYIQQFSTLWSMAKAL